MNIQEAIQSRTEEKPFITRKAWIINTWHGLEVKIFPTNTPNCCVVSSIAAKAPCRGWQPQMEDLIAEDWEVTD